MKNKNIIWGVIIVVIIIIIIVVSVRQSSQNTAATAGNNSNQSSQNVTVPISATQNTAVSSTLDKYQNEELGFSVEYPSTWKLEEDPSGPLFTIPVSTSTKNTIATLEASIYFNPGTCEFPPVATSTILAQSTDVSGSYTFNTLRVANTVKSLNYSNEMYTLQQGSVKYPGCYVFSFAGIADTPASKGYTGTAATTVSADNQSIITAAETDFAAMAKSFAVVTTAAGQSETAHPTGK